MRRMEARKGPRPHHYRIVGESHGLPEAVNRGPFTTKRIAVKVLKTLSTSYPDRAFQVVPIYQR